MKKAATANDRERRLKRKKRKREKTEKERREKVRGRKRSGEIKRYIHRRKRYIN